MGENIQYDSLRKEIFPIAYFPNTEYLRNLVNARDAHFEIMETYPKQSLRNRCEILTTNGPLKLTVPIKKPNGNKTRTGEILIDYNQNWQKIHLDSLRTAYRSSPYFEHYELEIETLLKIEYTTLWALNKSLLSWISQKLDLPLFDFPSTEEFLRSEETIDHRDNNFHTVESKKYRQVFSSIDGFVDHLSILDSLFCLGPMCRNLIL